MRPILVTMYAFFVCSIYPAGGMAAVIDFIPVTGFLNDSNGEALNGSFEMTIALYDAEQGGNRIWYENYKDSDRVEVEDGFVNIYLGEQTQLNLVRLVAAPELWLGITVEDDSEMNRIRLASTVFSLEAQVCQQVGTLTEDDIQPLLPETACEDGKLFLGWNNAAGAPRCSENPLHPVAFSGSYNDLVDIPSDILDGDNNTEYSAGIGLELTEGNVFNVQQSKVEQWAREVCFDTTTEVIDTLEGVFASPSHTHSWDELSNVPSGFADGVDDDTKYDAGAGIELIGTTFHAKGSPYEKTIVVAKEGGDFTDVQAAVDSVADGGVTADSPVLVAIMPGRYEAPVTLNPYVHLSGSGEQVTILTSAVENNPEVSDTPPTAATVVLAANTTLRDLTVENTGGGKTNVALLASGGVNNAVVEDVTIRAIGSSSGGSHLVNIAIYLDDTNTEVVLRSVSAEGLNCKQQNEGLHVGEGVKATAFGGTFSAVSSAEVNIGIRVLGTLEASRVICTVENANSNTQALSVYGGHAILRSGVFSARNGGYASTGIALSDNSVLEASHISVVAETGGNTYGLAVNASSTATVRFSDFYASGGNYCEGISCSGNGVNCTLESVTTKAENGLGNFGLYVNSSTGNTVVEGGTFSASGGTDTWGIWDNGNLEATNVRASGKNGSISNSGLYVFSGTASVTNSTLEGATESVTAYTGGAATIIQTRLIGGPTSGAVQCAAVSRGTTFGASGCP